MYKRLLLAALLLISTTAHADVISVAAFSADSSVDHLNTFRTTVVNVINGSIQGAGATGATRNIGADSIAEIDMSDDANPRIRDSYLLGITYDTISGGTAASQGAFVQSGGIQATDTDLTADVSAIIVFVNGYYISKAATAQTYAPSVTTYLWINQSGSYVQSTNPNTNVSNAALLASVVTSGTAITTVTDLASRRLPGLLVPSNYRNGMTVSRDSATTLTVFPGSIEINNTTISKASTTTLTLATAADWAGGSSLSAASTFGYVGIDTSGNLKMHTTAPTHQNYALSVTAGKKRYASWSSTTYRILGWFRMNGSTQLTTAETGNIKEGDVANSVISSDSTSYALTSTSFLTVGSINTYSSGGPLALMGMVSGDSVTGFGIGSLDINMDNTDINCSAGMEGIDGVNVTGTTPCMVTTSQGTHSFLLRAKVNQNTLNVRTRRILVMEQ